jgi:futalosine hydrolase
MSDRARILVVAATARELAAPDGWLTLRCGVGPVEAAAATAAAIALHRPAVILHVGVAGARRHRSLAAGTFVVGTEARYCDLPGSIPPEWAPRAVHASPLLLAAVQRALPEAAAMPIGTSARVGGTSGHPGCDVEAMEGFGVLRAAQLAGVPAVEVRAISNDVEEDDRARWRLDDAFAAITAVTPRLVAELLHCVS